MTKPAKIDKDQNQRLDELEERVEALENSTGLRAQIDPGTHERAAPGRDAEETPGQEPVSRRVGEGQAGVE